MKYAEIFLPYFKQGDDFDCCLRDSDNPVDALEKQVKMLEAAAEQLRAIKEKITGHAVEMHGCTHMISIHGEDALIQNLIDEELAVENEYGEDDEDYADEDGEDDADEEESENEDVQ